MQTISIPFDKAHHYGWNKRNDPVINVDPGDLVRIETRESSGGQISRNSTESDLNLVDYDAINPLTGPLFINGAFPGDTLAIDIVKIKIDDWGWTGVFDSRASGYHAKTVGSFLAIWEYEKNSARLISKQIPKVKIPIAPFCGMMGVAPPEEGQFSSIPPGAHGGNLDIKNLVEGSRLFLPIFVEGALFSVGDVHAAQGDGEVCTTAVETNASVELRFSLLKNTVIPEPRFETSTHFAVTAFSESLDVAVNKATGYMVDFLTTNCKLSKDQALVLCSVAGDLKIFEVVDKPHVLVGMTIDKQVIPPINVDKHG